MVEARGLCARPSVHVFVRVYAFGTCVCWCQTGVPHQLYERVRLFGERDGWRVVGARARMSANHGGRATAA